MDHTPLAHSEGRRPWGSLVLVALLLIASAGVWYWEEHGGAEWLRGFVDRQFPPDSEALVFWRLLSALGNGWILAMCLLCWLLVALRPERVLWCLVALLAAGFVVAVLKGLIDRPRPGGGGAAWPSGHSAAVFAVATLFPSERVRLVAAYPFALLVGCSRIALSRHHLSDVLAGAAFGLLCGAVLQRWNARLPIWLRAPALRLVAGGGLLAICLLRRHVDYQVIPMVGLFGAPLFLGCVLAILLRRPQAAAP